MKFYLAVVILFMVASCTATYKTMNAGKPFQGKIQQIPGKVECEFYNVGGEGVAYHDTDSVNNGSGKLNPANGTYLNEFRMKEGVDVSYTKSRDIDNNLYSKVPPKMDQLYVGWTMPGEWINYTIKVNESATYSIDLMYTCNGGGAISLDIDGKKATSDLKISSTHNDADTVKWRQWHHWNNAIIGNINLKKGIHILTIHIVDNGNMNLDYLDFEKAIIH